MIDEPTRTPHRRWPVRWLAVLPVLAVVLTACAGVSRLSGPAEPLVDDFVAAVVEGDLDSAWLLTGSDPTEPPGQPREGMGYALSRAHFRAAFGAVEEFERNPRQGWILTGRDGSTFNVHVAERGEGVFVAPTTWGVTVIDGTGEPVGLWVDGHPAAVTWRSRAHGLEWQVRIVTFEGPRTLEVELANGKRMTARVVREGDPPWQTCCVHFNGRTGEVTVFRPGPHRPEGM